MKTSCNNTASSVSDEDNSNNYSSSGGSSDEDSQPAHEVIQLHGINSTNSDHSFSNNEFGDQVILIQEKASAPKLSSLTCLDNLHRNLRAKLHLRFLHSEFRKDMKLKQRWILLLFILSAVLIVLFCTFLLRKNRLTTIDHYSQQLGITINVDELTERLKCPACFGVNLCPQITSGNINLNDWNRFAISKFANAKNIFYATWNDQGVDRQVVLKKLAHENELKQLDAAICDRHGKSNQCDVRQAVISLINTYAHKIGGHGTDDPFILHGEKIGRGSDMLLCPSHRKMEFLINAHKKFSRGQHHTTILANVLTTILVNPEPLYLQAFPASDGWPFPAYYGACGRIIMEQYIGRRLTTYYKESFLTRAHLAKQLLEIGNKFNENSSKFILYLTDITPDNFAVDENSNLVNIVDLENIIMVDKEVLIQSKVQNHDKILVSESTYCENNGNLENMCFSFSTDDLCDRPLTDHNYYAICAGLLAPSPLSDEFPDGLLHSVPQDLRDNTHFSQILEICKNPANATSSFPALNVTNRIEAAQTLIELLRDYLDKHKYRR